MYRIYIVFMFALLQKMCTKKITVGSFAVRCIDEVKAKDVLPFSSTVKRKLSEKCENITVPSLTYVCFIPAKGLIRGLSTNLSNIAFEVALASK